MKRKPYRNGERLIEFLVGEAVVFDLNKFITVILFSQWLTVRSAGRKEGEEMPREGFLTLPPDSGLCIGVEVFRNRNHHQAKIKTFLVAALIGAGFKV